ncbi:MAG: hypothetical protein WCT31_02820 [Candidatus Micrarchaeia archaeon]|jgi:hypothetical protein
MVEISRIKIRKQLYRFEVKRRFQYLRHFKLKERPPIVAISASVKKLFAKNQKTKKIERGVGHLDGSSESVGKSVKRSNVILYTAIFAAILILIGGWWFVSSMNSAIAAANSAQQIISSELPDFNFDLVGSGIASAGSKNLPFDVAYLRFAYHSKNFQEMNLSFSTYASELPSEVFILHSRMYDSETSTYPQFKDALKKELAKKKINVNEIDIEQLSSIPKGAVIIVPSGYVPQELLGVGSSFDIGTLAQRGAVVLYIGYPLDKMIDAEGDIVPAPANLSSGLRLRFIPVSASPSGIAITGPFYSVESAGSNSYFTAYGVVSGIRVGSGVILFVPKSLDVGWKSNGGAAAVDISKIVLENVWASPDSPTVTYPISPEISNTTVEEFFTNGFAGDSRFVKMSIDGTDLNGNYFGEVHIFEVKKGTSGFLYLEGGTSVVSSEITGADTRVFAQLREPGVSKQVLYFAFLKNGGRVGEKIVANPQAVSLQVDTQFDVPISLDGGSYLLNIEDYDGKVYAQSLLKVVFVDIVRKPDIDERKIFHFTFEKDGQPVVLHEVKVKVISSAGESFGEYSFTDTSDPKIDVSKNVFGEGKLPFGNYNFQFTIGNIVKDVPVSLIAPENIFTSLPFVGTAVISIVILGVGYYFSRKENTRYQLDIPDFPPIAKTKIPMKADTVIGVFGRVNEDYKWKCTPLTVQEIKNGFRKVFFEGKPIFISDYNVEFIMDRLIQRKKMLKSLDYYAPLSWEQETGRSITYLAMFRKMRDIFVENAVPFSKMGDEKNCDSKIDLMGQEMFIHIYEKRGDMKRLAANILSTSKLGLSIVLFKNDGEKDDFRDVLSSASQVSISLKLEVESGAVHLLRIIDFEALIKDMKSV